MHLTIIDRQWSSPFWWIKSRELRIAENKTIFLQQNTTRLFSINSYRIQIKSFVWSGPLKDLYDLTHLKFVMIQGRSSNRYVKHRRNSQSVNGRHPTTSLIRARQTTQLASQRATQTTQTSDDLSFESSSSDRGICVNSSSDFRDFDTDHLIGFRDRFSRRNVDEEEISLAFLYESAALYKYRAARGQVRP